MASQSCSYIFLLLLIFQANMIKGTTVVPPSQCRPVVASTLERIEFLVNLIIFKTELFLRSSTGLGINDISPGLVQGPDPVGATVANLDDATRDVIEEFGLSGVGYLRAIVNTIQLDVPIPRPLLNISAGVFASFTAQVLNLSTPFDIYANTTNFLFAVADVSSLLRQYYTGMIPSVIGNTRQQLVAGIALHEAAVSGAIRALLNTRVNETISPYTFTVANLTNLIGQAINQVAGCGVKDEGLIVPIQLGAENRTTSNVIPGDVNSLAFPRFEREILRVVFGSGNATRPGAFFPSGFNGTLFRRIVALRLS